MTVNNKSIFILITGASSGIGRACALLLAKPNVSLYLIGRNHDSLVDVSRECIRRGAMVHIKQLDVCNQDEMKFCIQSIERLDFVLACAGVSAGTVTHGGLHSLPESEEVTRQIIQTNIGGVLNTILPAIDVMRRQTKDTQNTRGRIAAIASVAAFFNSSWAPSYCASKAAVDRLMVSMGGVLERDGIYLSSVCCGFIKTSMTSNNHFVMPGMLSADQAAKIIIKGVVAKKRRIIFPLWMGIIAKGLDLLPAGFLERFYLHYLEKKEHKGKYTS